MPIEFPLRSKSEQQFDTASGADPMKTSSIKNSPRPHRWLLILGILVSANLPTSSQVATDPDPTRQAAQALESVRDGSYSRRTLEDLSRLKAVQAVPALEEQFDKATDPLNKGKIASCLVRLGDDKDKYWSYLITRASAAAESDEPDPINHHPASPRGDGISPSLRNWAEAHNADPESAAEEALLIFPADILNLGQTHDPRAIPILRAALRSANPLVAAASAESLADLGDKRSIPLIIKACGQASPDGAVAIARWLVYFDDPEAQQAVDVYVPQATAKALRAARANGQRPFGN